MHEHRARALEIVSAHAVTLLRGATGCGKSTQLPQQLLDTSEPRFVLVVQPRRLAAVALAERVASELGEQKLVGYSIRGESRKGSHVEFCTTGVLLRRLEGGDSLGGVTHLVLDEVHERSAELDLALAAIRKMHAATPSAAPRTVLMSATVESGPLVSYFEAVGVRVGQVDVPGRTFPVEQKYIDDVDAAAARPAATKKQSAAEAAAVEAAALRAQAAAATSEVAKANLSERARKAEAAAGAEVGAARADAVDDELVERLVLEHHAARVTPYTDVGAVLVFLPGVAEISALVARLQTHTSLLPMPLHSGLQTADQRQCFQRAPARRTKVVVATDIAEASVTIPDVTLVVDCGLHRTVVSDERTGVASLVTARVSRAAAQQRAGRAGRVRAGTAIHLFRRAELETMAAHPTAEVLRAPLDAIVLRARVLAGDAEAGQQREGVPRGVVVQDQPQRNRRDPHRSSHALSSKRI